MCLCCVHIRGNAEASKYLIAPLVIIALVLVGPFSAGYFLLSSTPLFEIFVTFKADGMTLPLVASTTIWMLILMGSAMASYDLVPADGVPLATLFLIFVLSSIIALPALIYKMIKEGEHGLLRLRWKVERLRPTFVNFVAMVSIVISVFQRSALCFLPDGLWEGSEGSQAKSFFRAFVGLTSDSVSGRALTAVSIIFFISVQIFLAVVLRPLFTDGLGRGRGLASQSGILVGFFTGPGYSVAMQVLLDRMMSLTENSIGLGFCYAYILCGYSLAALLLNVASAGRPSPNRDLSITGATQVFQSISDLALTAVSVLNRFGKITDVGSLVFILLLNVFWGVVFLANRPSTLRGFNIGLAAARFLPAWTAVTAMLPLKMGAPLMVLACGWAAMILIAFLLWRLDRIFPFEVYMGNAVKREDIQKIIDSEDVPAGVSEAAAGEAQIEAQREATGAAGAMEEGRPRAGEAEAQVRVATGAARALGALRPTVVVAGVILATKNDVRAPQSAVEYRINRGRSLLNATAQVNDPPNIRIDQLNIAAAEFHDASQLEPERPDIWDLKATALFQLKKFQEAREAAGMALSLQPTAARSNFLGIILIQCKLFVEAVEAAKQAIRARGPVRPYAYATRALAEAHLGNFEEAVRCIEKAETFEGHVGEFAKERAVIHELQHEAHKQINIEITDANVLHL